MHAKGVLFIQIINKQNELQQLFLAEATGQGNKHAHKC
jgi:hypothetical protein